MTRVHDVVQPPRVPKGRKVRNGRAPQVLVIELLGRIAWQRPERIRVSEVALPSVGEKVDKVALRKREIGNGVSTAFSTPEHT